MNLKVVSFLLVQFRNFSASAGGSAALRRMHGSRNHYDSLGVTKAATQADVKAAYYELSKVYHPDKNQGNEESAQKFRDITEAYEVLGNAKLRRMYDKGLYVDQRDTETAPQSDDPMNRFYRSRQTRSRPPPPSGRTPIYDFDEWSRQHYGATFHRSQEAKRQRKSDKQMQMDIREEKAQNVILMVMGIFLACALIIQYENKKYDDTNKYPTPNFTSIDN